MYIYEYVIDRYAARTEYGAVVNIPKGAIVLSAGNLYGNLVVWAKFSNKAIPLEERRFKIIRTGEPFDDSLLYIGTVIFNNGDTINHLFEVK